MDKTWNNVVVHPWVGNRFQQPTIFSRRTLVLGESNYTKPELFSSQLVINCVLDDMGDPQDPERDSSGFCRFSTKVRRIIFGRETGIAPADFWREAAFYNFVQERVGENARERPTPEMWKMSVPAFTEIVSALRPERILVLGKGNWNNLRTHVENMSLDDWTAELTVGNQSIRAGYVNHPSSSLRYDVWHPRAKRLLAD